MAPRILLLMVVALGTAGHLEAQHAYTPADIEAGGRLYQSTCVGCHGPDGDAITGVRLASGQFRGATSDEELVRIIIDGITGTPMPPNKFSEADAGTIVAYLRSMTAAGSADTTTMGDAGRGKTIVEGKGSASPATVSATVARGSGQI
jgi:mono/diheme cytochrome c family protein